jgi:hypothetical protein
MLFIALCLFDDYNLIGLLTLYLHTYRERGGVKKLTIGQSESHRAPRTTTYCYYHYFLRSTCTKIILHYTRSTHKDNKKPRRFLFLTPHHYYSWGDICNHALSTHENTHKEDSARPTKRTRAATSKHNNYQYYLLDLSDDASNRHSKESMYAPEFKSSDIVGLPPHVPDSNMLRQNRGSV